MCARKNARLARASVAETRPFPQGTSAPQEPSEAVNPLRNGCGPLATLSERPFVAEATRQKGSPGLPLACQRTTLRGIAVNRPREEVSRAPAEGRQNGTSDQAHCLGSPRALGGRRTVRAPSGGQHVLVCADDISTGHRRPLVSPGNVT